MTYLELCFRAIIQAAAQGRVSKGMQGSCHTPKEGKGALEEGRLGRRQKEGQGYMKHRHSPRNYINIMISNSKNRKPAKTLGCKVLKIKLNCFLFGFRFSFEIHFR